MGKQRKSSHFRCSDNSFAFKLLVAVLAAIEAADLTREVVLSVQCIDHVVADATLEVSFELIKVQLQFALALLQVAIICFSIKLRVYYDINLAEILSCFELKVKISQEDVRGLH